MLSAKADQNIHWRKRFDDKEAELSRIVAEAEQKQAQLVERERERQTYLSQRAKDFDKVTKALEKARTTNEPLREENDILKCSVKESKAEIREQKTVLKQIRMEQMSEEKKARKVKEAMMKKTAELESQIETLGRA
ncbi:hypothetical protein NpNSSI1_00008812 [Neofusicoccum parvum]|nr:hypothetical protein NpNSSI1_00008812 [Neofusicoccum parvum]